MNSNAALSEEIVYLEMRGVKFRISTTILSLLPDSILVALFPTGLVVPKLLLENNAGNRLNFNIDSSMDDNLDNVDPSIFGKKLYFELFNDFSNKVKVNNFDPRLFRFLIKYFKQILAINDERSLQAENKILDRESVIIKDDYTVEFSSNKLEKNTIKLEEDTQNEKNQNIVYNPDSKISNSSSKVESEKNSKLKKLKEKIFRNPKQSKTVKSDNMKNGYVDKLIVDNNAPGSDPFPGNKVIHQILMLKEELEFYILPGAINNVGYSNIPSNDEKLSTTDDVVESCDRNSLFKWKGKRRSSIASKSSRKSIDKKYNEGGGHSEILDGQHLNLYLPQIKAICSEYFTAQLPVSGKNFEIELDLLSSSSNSLSSAPNALSKQKLFNNQTSSTSALSKSSNASVDDEGNKPTIQDDFLLSPYMQQKEFIQSLKSHTHFQNDTHWNYRESDYDKSRIVSVAMLQLKDVIDPLLPAVKSQLAQSDDPSNNKQEQKIIPLEKQHKMAQIDVPDLITSAQDHRQVNSSGIYQSMLYRRPIRKYWWEITTVPTTLEVLEKRRLNSLKQGYSTSSLSSELKQSDSLQNLTLEQQLQLQQQNFKNNVNFSNNSCAIPKENVNSVDTVEDNNRNSGTPTPIDKNFNNSNNVANGNGILGRRKNSKANEIVVKFNSNGVTNVDIKVWTRKSWFCEFSSV
ncbi:hypothetical protein HDU92_000215 [Lobulomyces angularis]|nr:hypothetical protein HDU92_000215 [Lobulomyces angularis]